MDGLTINALPVRPAGAVLALSVEVAVFRSVVSTNPGKVIGQGALVTFVF